ncbi:MAG TPA: class I SAM-dependent methyltransferase [Candidatus Polarisedimenticolaceae bacterium]|nr:class I SAM-dependent methyltransferase [Candidatus Polarisedimenticolaceae bacterium]
MGQARIWEYFQNEGAGSFRLAGPRLRYVAGLFAAGADVLDIGVGDGTFERLAAARGVRVFVLDPDSQAIERARTELSLGDRARTGLIDKLPWPDGSFDGVVVSEVLEHLDDATLAAGLDEIRRVLKPGGRIVGTVPADEPLESQRVVCPDCGRRFHRWGHEQSFSPERMQSLLAGRFDAPEVTRRWFVPWSHLNWKGKIHGAIRKALAVAGQWGEGHNLVFVARRGQ